MAEPSIVASTQRSADAFVDDGSKQRVAIEPMRRCLETTVATLTSAQNETGPRFRSPASFNLASPPVFELNPRVCLALFRPLVLTPPPSRFNKIRSKQKLKR